MSKKEIYIIATSQISIQPPLTEEWMMQPVRYDVEYTRSMDPDFKRFLSPMEARRMGKLLKRALVTSLDAIQKSGIAPEAIITGTGLGCIENTEIFLDALCRDGEQFLKPTYFMQSTHNTISSLIGIHTKTHGYNITYAHKGISFDSALWDAWTQLQLGKIHSALVGGHDEMSPSYFSLLKKIGFVGQNKEIAGEANVSVVLSDVPTGALVRITAMKMCYKPTLEKVTPLLSSLLDEAGISLNDLSGVVTGISGQRANDEAYTPYLQQFFPEVPVLAYKPLFGECYTASGLGFYAAVSCLQHGLVPDALYLHSEQRGAEAPKNLLLLNLAEHNLSVVLLQKICGK
jgi:3-oxoacyl-(acyl-carrier-protein) synthase